jgi:hypothetical protein
MHEICIDKLNMQKLNKVTMLFGYTNGNNTKCEQVIVFQYIKMYIFACQNHSNNVIIWWSNKLYFICSKGKLSKLYQMWISWSRLECCFKYIPTLIGIIVSYPCFFQIWINQIYLGIWMFLRSSDLALSKLRISKNNFIY